MGSSSAPRMTIGKLAREAGVGVETIRFYEREGLLKAPPRDPLSGYRKYEVAEIRRLAFIGRAKDLGFTLREIRDLLDLRASGEVSCAAMQGRAQARLEGVRRKIRDLQHIEAALSALAVACPEVEEGGECPILAALDGGFADEAS